MSDFDRFGLRISEELGNFDVNVSLGLIIYSLRSTRKAADLKTCIAEEVAAARHVLAGAKPSSLPVVQAARAAFKRLGKDPSRYRPSSEALLRRIAAGKELYRVNDVVDLSNIISIHTQMPVCSYDFQSLRMPITFRRGNAGEHYQGIGRADINLEGLPVFSDRTGSFGTPFSDSERTKVISETMHVLTILVSFDSEVDLDVQLKWSRKLLSQHLDLSEIETRVMARR